MDATSATTLVRMDTIFALQRAAYAGLPMPSLEQRKGQLTRLKTLLLEHKDAIAAAINADFTARSADETMLGEIMPCLQSIDHTLKHLHGWMKDDMRSVGLHFMPASARVVYQPLGVVGIIVPFNYPLNLAIVPLVTAGDRQPGDAQDVGVHAEDSGTDGRHAAQRLR